MNKKITILGQKIARQIDIDLVTIHYYSLDQLMELAGLSVACSIAKEYPVLTNKRVLICCGPGNNGGDGLVTARHLSQFGYDCSLVYPNEIKASNVLYNNIYNQCFQMGIPIYKDINNMNNDQNKQDNYDIYVDAIFGFSFNSKRIISKQYNNCINYMIKAKKPIISIDIPSGWDVEEGDINHINLEPDMLVSLTLPKLCSRYFNGRYHYVGGRFVPTTMIEKYNLFLPEYLSCEQCINVNDYELI